MNKFIPLSVPSLKGRELEYVTEAIKTEWVSTGGPFVKAFEDKIADYVGTKEAVSCQSGTAGLHLALRVCGVEKGDEVLVPTLTFIAAVNPVRYVGAEPIFMDCDDSLCIDPHNIRAFCLECCDFIDGKLYNKQTKRRVKALVVVHVFGNMADMVEIMKIARDFNLKVIEDATEALGSYYIEGPLKGAFAGTIGDVGVYSFNGNKIMTTGGGGMIVSHHKKLLKKMRHWSTQAKADELYYIHDDIGYNYRMTNLQAAVGLGQLEQLESFIERKTKNFKHYEEKINLIKGLSLKKHGDEIRSNYWFYALQCQPEYKKSRDELIQHLGDHKIQTRPIWGLIHQQVPYKDCETYKIEKAITYWQHIVNIPCSSNLKLEEIQTVVAYLE